MILNEEDAIERLESPLNLLNRLRSISEAKPRHPALPLAPPSISELIQDVDDKIITSKISASATDVLSDSLSMLKERLPEIQKAKDLAVVAFNMNKILIGISDAQRVKEETKPSVNFIFYKPRLRAEDDYEIINVSE